MEIAELPGIRFDGRILHFRILKGEVMSKFSKYSLARKTDELKKLIEEHPDYEIVVLAGEEANGGDYAWMFCTDISFGINEILDCDFYDYNDCVFTDRDRLEEKIEDDLYDEYCDKPQEEYEAAIKAEVAKYEPYWKNVIAIYADN